MLKYQGTICKGSYALGTACGRCERCAAERKSEGKFQLGVDTWMLTTFGHEISDDMVERGDRLAEEVFELLQSKGYDFGRLVQLMAYVDGRPTGDPKQEVGGVMVTLAAFCTAAKLDMYEAGWEELSRVWDNIVQIRAKQRSKAGICTPLPVPPEVARAATAPDGTDWVTRASEFASVALGNAQEVCRLHARVRELEAECARWATGAHGQ